MTLCLWNGALMRNQKVVDMVRDADKTQSFIDNALTPLVAALAGRNGLGAWEIMNEPGVQFSHGVSLLPLGNRSTVKPYCLSEFITVHGAA